MYFRARKVFCIGFNKTGTTSLHNFFQECSLKSVHNEEWPYYSRVQLGKFYFRYQCYSDGEQSDFVKLDSWFPNSLFILNNRNERDWLYSRVKHVLRYNEDINVETVYSSSKYGRMAREFIIDEESAISKWIAERRIYIRQTKKYFGEQSNFIEIDVTRNEDWSDVLIDFFNENRFSIDRVSSENAIHSNKRSEHRISNQRLLDKYKSLIDQKLSI